MEQHNKLEDLNLSVELLQRKRSERRSRGFESTHLDASGLSQENRQFFDFMDDDLSACSSPHSNMSDFHVQHRPMAVESKPSHDNVSPLPTPSASRQLRQRLEAFGVRTAMQALTGQQRQEETIPKKRLTLIMRRNRQQDHHRINRTTQNWTSQLNRRLPGK